MGHTVSPDRVCTAAATAATMLQLPSQRWKVDLLDYARIVPRQTERTRTRDRVCTAAARVATTSRPSTLRWKEDPRLCTKQKEWDIRCPQPVCARRRDGRDDVTAQHPASPPPPPPSAPCRRRRPRPRRRRRLGADNPTSDCTLANLSRDATMATLPWVPCATNSASKSKSKGKSKGGGSRSPGRRSPGRPAEPARPPSTEPPIDGARTAVL